MNEESRHRLLQRQAELLQFLMQGGTLPTGFDERNLEATAGSLIAKRRRALLDTWPVLSTVEGIDSALNEYLRVNPLDETASPMVDGREFVRWSKTRFSLPESVHRMAFEFDQRYVVRNGALQIRSRLSRWLFRWKTRIGLGP